MNAEEGIRLGRKCILMTDENNFILLCDWKPELFNSSGLW